MVGNLAHEEARMYFFDYVLPFHKHPPGADAAWERVYEVCGGNPGDLGCCALEVTKFSSWELGVSCVLACAVSRICCRTKRGLLTGCDAIVQGAMKDISKALSPETFEGAAWSSEDFRSVLETIVSSPHAAVLIVELVAVLGAGGAAKLESMNKLNLLMRRAYNPLARDIDAAAFGRKKKEVYTLPSAAHVLAACIELDM